MYASMLLALAATAQLPVDLNAERERVDRQLEIGRIDANLGFEQAQRMDDRASLQSQIEELRQRLSRMERNGASDGLWSLIRSELADADGQIESADDPIRRLLIEDHLRKLQVDSLDAKLRVAKASAEFAVLQRLGAKGMASKQQRDQAETQFAREQAEFERLSRLSEGLAAWLDGRWPDRTAAPAVEMAEVETAEPLPEPVVPTPPTPERRKPD
jgi:hypothetical protein